MNNIKLSKMYLFFSLFMILSVDGNGLVYAGKDLCSSICSSEDIATGKVKCNNDNLNYPENCPNGYLSI